MMRTPALLVLLAAIYGAHADISTAALGDCRALPNAAIRLAIDPDIDSALADLATQIVLHAEYDEWEQASVVLERALRLWPKDTRLWCLLARVRWRQGKYEQAEAMARKAQVLSGKSKLPFRFAPLRPHASAAAGSTLIQL